MEDLFLRLKDEIVRQQPVVLLTVVDSAGSTPRDVASHALLCQEGTLLGTIGGGAVEGRALETAQQVFSTKSSTLMHMALHRAAEDDIGAVCGGDTRVFCQYFEPGVPGGVEWATTVLTAQTEHLPYVNVLSLTSAKRWGMGLMTATDVITCGDEVACDEVKAYIQEHGHALVDTQALWLDGKKKWYCERMARPGRVFVFGAGHVAKALVPVLASIDFPCVVIDDRREFANAERFPDAEEIMVGDMAQVSHFLHMTHYDYAIIMTRGHVSDYEVEKQILPWKPGYIGVIGSQAKLAFVRNKLLADGFTPEELDAVYAPIGLPISAQTPAEIAVSVAAQLIAVRARKENREKGLAKKWGAADAHCICLEQE